jgi:Kef-type K+ transport system membrane component KefB/nucleotide-binding universal stress UspA family protein
VKGGTEFLFLLQVMVLILTGRLLGELMQRIGQPTVLGPLMAGLLLGPSVLGAVWPHAQQALFPPAPEQKSMLDGLSQFGVLMLLLLAGMETDLGLARRTGSTALSVSIAGICVPFVCGFLLGQYLPDALLPDPSQRFVASLFVGTALSISSVKIVAVVVREMNFSRRDVGQIILASAVFDDTIGWIIIAITLGVAGRGTLDAWTIARSVLGTALFLAVSLTLGRRIVFSLIRWANDHLASEMAVLTVILLLMGAMALLTDVIGVQTVLGAFVAGILVGESPILTGKIDEQLRGLVAGLFMPIFFGTAGLSADLTILGRPELLALTLGLVLIASVGKFSGAFIGGTIGGLTPRQCLALASGMNARGSTEVIVASIGLSMGVLSQNLFTMIVAMAIITTMAMPPMLRWALLRLPTSEEEEARLEREAFEQRGFLPNVERLLLAIDESRNGRFASRLAGILAGARGLPTTVLHVGPNAERRSSASGPEDSPEAAFKAGAETTAETEAKLEDQKPDKVDITTRSRGGRHGKAADAVANEARRGYDLMVIGVGKVTAPNGGFRRDVGRVAAGFDGPLALVVARGEHLEHPTESKLSVLVPITGTEVTRRAAEVAVALARANKVGVRALYVSGGGSEKRARRRVSMTRRHEEEILKDIVALGERYDTVVRTIVRGDAAPDEAILREARDEGCNLIVMGVNRRPGEALFFGNVAAAVLENAKASILFVSS